MSSIEHFKQEALRQNKQRQQKFEDLQNNIQDNFFSEINPLNLQLEDLKQQLVDEIDELRIDLAEFHLHPEKYEHLTDQGKSDLYEKISNEIKQKMDWVMHIDNSLVLKNSNSFEDSEEYIINHYDNMEKNGPTLN